MMAPVYMFLLLVRNASRMACPILFKASVVGVPAPESMLPSRWATSGLMMPCWAHSEMLADRLLLSCPIELLPKLLRLDFCSLLRRDTSLLKCV